MPRFQVDLNATGPIVTKTGIVDRAIRPSFSAAQMESIGQYDIEIMKDRVAQLRDIYDRPEPPLTPKYARRKSSKGLQPVRNLEYSGIMLNALSILNVTDNEVKVGLKGTVPFRKALFNQNIDPWFGISDRDKERLMEEKIRPMWQQVVADLQKG